MLATSSSKQMSLENLLEHIFTIRRITRQDQQLLMSALLSKDGLSEQEHQQINRVFDALKKGLLKVVD
ncbi:hypothetical protein [Nostoc sp. FACHB-110]|uniref:hypothetical protein n=1 Tax=Nostoc sp. FACHB-110 TaxID=2692834 RepID=UPI001681DD12|nr:hypothetical protein [Nostoc sp. FACHB-110]MBD2436573.1 hypothetical protein [Nostoc sp. FACHB-110]